MVFNTKYLPVIFFPRGIRLYGPGTYGGQLLFGFNYSPSSAYGGKKSSSEPENIRDLKYWSKSHPRLQFTLLVSLLKIDRYCNNSFCTTYSSAAVHCHAKWCRRSCGLRSNFAPLCSMVFHWVSIFYRFHDIERVKRAGSHDSNASC